MTMSADFSAPLTTSELDRLLDTLPASERAELSWSRPGLRAALDGLLTGPLDREALDSATRSFVRIMLGLKRMILRMAREYPPYFAFAIAAAVHKRRDRLVVFLGSETLVAHVEQAAKAIGAVLGSAKENLPRLLEQIPEDDQKLDALIDSELQSSAASIVYAEVLFAALFEVEDKNGSRERGRELARLALVAAVDGMMALREHGVTLLVEDTVRPQEDEDELLATMASTALRGTNDEAMRAGQWVRARMPEHAFVPTPEPPAVEKSHQRTRLTRHVGQVAAVQLVPSPMVGLISDGVYKRLAATPEMVERTWALRGATVEALTLQTSGAASLGMFAVTGRLVRIDPASGEQAPDSATRTHDMIRDWDEVLQRLAQ